MSYQRLLQQVAREHNSTPKEVEQEIKTDMQIAGYDIEPALFISLIASKVKNELL